MEGLTRLVSESMARHGFDRPLDYRRLRWSRWFRCESHHSLLFVPSKPGVFALAEEIMHISDAPVGMDAFVRPASEASGVHVGTAASGVPRSEASGAISEAKPLNPEAEPRRMLAVTQFFEDDDMAFVLDRMLSSQNPMRARLVSGRYFVRFVVIEDQTQRRTICNALNQWMVTATEKVTGIGSHFATSLELTPASEYVSDAADAQQPLFAGATGVRGADAVVRPPERSEIALGIVSGAPASHSSQTTPQPDPGAAINTHRSNSFPSGF
jgi:hypothetical protein